MLPPSPLRRRPVRGALRRRGARKGYCLYKVGCKGPTTYNVCSTVEWNGGLSWPVKSGHGCLRSAEDNFWDKGSFYSSVTNLGVTGKAEATANSIGGILSGAAAVGVAADAAHTIGRHMKGEKRPESSRE
jgi:hydrogenase small subunit